MIASKKLVLSHVFILLFTTSIIFGASEEVTWGKWIWNGLIGIKDHFVGVGKGEQAIQDNVSLTKALESCIPGTFGQELAKGVDKLVNSQKKVIAALPNRNLINASAGVGVVWGSISIIKSMGDCCRWMYFLIKPSEEDSLRKEKVKQELRAVKAVNSCNDLRDCLARNRNSIKDNDGMPINCREAAQACLDNAGEEEYDKIKREYLARQKHDA